MAHGEAGAGRRGRAIEFVRFSVVGCSGTIVNLGAYYGLTRFLAVPIATASPVAIELSILWNFALNDLWTFAARRTGRSPLQRLGRFHAVALVAGAINYALLLLLTGLGLWDIASNLAGIALGTLAKFGANSWWTWPEPGSGSRGSTVLLREGHTQ